MTVPTRHARWLLAATLTALLAGACAGTDETTPDAQPSTEATVFVGGAFDSIPRYPRTEEAGSLTEEAGVSTQSFTVRNTRPRDIIDFYAARLEELWQVSQEPEEVGNGTFRGVWVQGERELLVTTAPAPTAGGDEVTAQYSLELGPKR